MTIKPKNLPLVPLCDYRVAHSEAGLVGGGFWRDVLPGASVDLILVLAYVARVICGADHMDGLEFGVISHHG